MNPITFYQIANLTDQEVIKQFIVRRKEYERVISEIRRDDMKGSIQHYIFIGQRGSGKSTLLRRIEAEINTNTELSSRLVAVNLSEEQAGIYRLHDLWDRVCDELNVKGICVEEINWEEFDEDLTAYAKAIYGSIQNSLKKENKKLVLLLDNIDRVLENIKTNDTHLFRELLMNFKDVRIIGGSTRLSEHHWKYDQPFYEFFSVIQLQPLSLDEMKELLLFWGELLNEPTLVDFVKNKAGRLNAVRILSDGMPRTMLNFLELLINQPNQQGYEYLRHIVDRATPIYQERLNCLTAFQQKAVLELSFFWDAVKVKELSKATKIESKTLSANLNQLVELQIVEKIQGRGKNMMYRLKERFFNFWLVMTQGGPKQKSQVKWLTIFLETWYEANELKAICFQFLKDMSQGKILADQAILRTKALVHSKYISIAERDLLLENVTTIIKPNNNYMELLPPKAMDIIIKAGKYLEEKEYEKALNELESIEQDDARKYIFMGIVFATKNDFKSAEQNFIKANKKGDRSACLMLARLYSQHVQIEKAKKYYLEAIDKNIPDATFEYAIFFEKERNKEDAEKYYLMAIEKGNIKAVSNLAAFYKEEGRIDEAEKYYIKAIQQGDEKAIHNLAIFYDDDGRKEEAEKYYLIAVEQGNVKAINNLAVFYEGNGQRKDAEKYYLIAIEKGNIKAVSNLAAFYKEEGRKEEAEKYYLMAVEKGNEQAIRNLAIFYEEEGRKDDAEKYYLMAVQRGSNNAILDLADYYNAEFRDEEAEKYYLLSIEKDVSNAIYNYCVFLYSRNKEKERVYRYFEENIEVVENDLKTKAFEMLISVWNGRFEKLENAKEIIVEILKAKNVALLEMLLKGLLTHYQSNMIWQWFQDEQTGAGLKNLVRPLYYVTASFINNDFAKEELLSIAPEFKETVDSIYDEVIEMQRHFYN